MAQGDERAEGEPRAALRAGYGLGFHLSPALSAWNRLESKPFGKALFSRFLCWKAPYFSTITPRFEELRPGYARIAMRKRRGVTNHIGAVATTPEIAAGPAREVPVRVDVTNRAGDVVCRATITMWVSPRKSA